MRLTWRVRLSYAIGHVLNDLCASVWFTYTLIYFNFGIKLSSTLAGTIVLIGQIADGLATPIVGIFSDTATTPSSLTPRPSVATAEAESPNGYSDLSDDDDSIVDPPRDEESNPRYLRLKRVVKFLLPRGRKAWHMGGTLMTIIAFPLIFANPLDGYNLSPSVELLFYAPAVIVFQWGWAAVQVTHLALMNDLTLDPGERTLLTSLRYFFTVLSNLAVYIATYLLLNRDHRDVQPQPVEGNGLLSRLGHPILLLLSTSSSVNGDGAANGTSDKPHVDFGPEDLPAFRLLTFCILGCGGLASLLFHLGVRRADSIDYDLMSSLGDLDDEAAPILPRGNAESPQIYQTRPIRSWRCWLKLPRFWILGFFYMTIRMIVNISQAYIAVYLLHALNLPKSTMALIPLTIYLLSMASLFVQKPVQDYISRELNVTIGLALVTVFCVMVAHPGDPPSLPLVYTMAGVLGVGCAIILVTTLSMVSDLIGYNQSKGAFVYGYMSLVDKFANGVAIQTIERLSDLDICNEYSRKVESYGIGAITVAAMFFLILYTVVRFRCRNCQTGPFKWKMLFVPVQT